MRKLALLALPVGLLAQVITLPGPPPLKLPPWLAPFPLARVQSSRGSANDAKVSYAAAVRPEKVVEFYHRELQLGGIVFETKPGDDGNIQFDTGKAIGSVRIRAAGEGSTVEVSYSLKPEPPPTPPAPVTNADLSGTWNFAHWGGRFRGTIQLQQTGSVVRGTWHTSYGKVEPDDPVAGRVSGNTLMLTRFVGDNQRFELTLSPDGHRMEGYGEGFFLNHTDLAMERADEPTAPAAPSKKGGLGTTPPQGTYKWAMQSTGFGQGAARKYKSFYYEVPTGRSVEEPLRLPGGGEIVSVFPDDCEFVMRNDAGKALDFRSQDEAKGASLGAGTWALYPLRCNGVVVYVK